MFFLFWQVKILKAILNRGMFLSYEGLTAWNILSALRALDAGVLQRDRWLALLVDMAGCMREITSYKEVHSLT